MKNGDVPTLHDFRGMGGGTVKALLCDPEDGVCGVGVKEIGFGVSPAGKRRVMVRKAYMLQFITDGGGVFCGSRFGCGDVLFSTPCEPEIRETVGERGTLVRGYALSERTPKGLYRSAELPLPATLKTPCFPAKGVQRRLNISSVRRAHPTVSGADSCFCRYFTECCRCLTTPKV